MTTATTNGKATNRIAAVEEKAANKKHTVKQIVIEAPNFRTAIFHIRGTAAYCQNRFSEKARAKMRETQVAGEQSRKGAKRDPKNFEEGFKNSLYVSKQGWYGIPAGAFRNAMISACVLAGFFKTLGKKTIFILADGLDSLDDTPLVKISNGQPRYAEHTVRNANGQPDIRPRGMFDEWEVTVRVQYDADFFEEQSLANLIVKAGIQVGVGEGRPDSKKSNGLGWGTWELVRK